MGALRTILIGAAVLAGLGLGAALLWEHVLRKRYEEPSYEVVGRIGELEVRRYDPYLVAVTEVEGTQDEATSEGFRRLAGYIFGKNVSRKSISMTTPVSQQKSEKIDMTTPVGVERRGETHRVTFAMPAAYTEETLPEPLDERVHLERVPERTVAVLSFSGTTPEKVVREKERELLGTLRSHGREPVGEPILARYDPPWVPGFARRNELQVELAPAEQGADAP